MIHVKSKEAGLMEINGSLIVLMKDDQGSLIEEGQTTKGRLDISVGKADAAITVLRHTDSKATPPEGFVKSHISFIAST